MPQLDSALKKVLVGLSLIAAASALAFVAFNSGSRTKEEEEEEDITKKTKKKKKQDQLQRHHSQTSQATKVVQQTPKDDTSISESEKMSSVQVTHILEANTTSCSSPAATVVSGHTSPSSEGKSEYASKAAQNPKSPSWSQLVEEEEKQVKKVSAVF